MHPVYFWLSIIYASFGTSWIMLWSEHYQRWSTGTVFRHIDRLDIRTIFRVSVMTLPSYVMLNTFRNRHTVHSRIDTGKRPVSDGLHCFRRYRRLCSLDVLITLIIHFFIMQAEIMEMQKNEVTVNSKLRVFDPCILSWCPFWFAKNYGRDR